MVRRFKVLDVEWEARQPICFVVGHGYPVRLRRVDGTNDDEIVGRISRCDVFAVEDGEIRHELLRRLEIARCWSRPSVTRR